MTPRKPLGELTTRMGQVRPASGSETLKLNHRITLDVDTVRYEALRKGAYDHRVPITCLIRALIQIWAEDTSSPTADRAAELARLEAEAIRRRKA